MKGRYPHPTPEGAQKFCATFTDCPQCGVPKDVFCINLAVVKAGVAKNIADTVWPHPQRYLKALEMFNKGDSTNG